MARRPRLFVPGLLYHVIARGNQWQPTFLDDLDYQAYLGRLATYLRSPDRSQSVATARAVVSFVLVKRLGYRVADVAAALGRDVATVSVIVSRLANRMETSERIAADVTRVSQKCLEVKA